MFCETRLHGPFGVPFAQGLVYLRRQISRLWQCARAMFGYDVHGKWPAGAVYARERVEHYKTWLSTCWRRRHPYGGYVGSWIRAKECCLLLLDRRASVETKSDRCCRIALPKCYPTLQVTATEAVGSGCVKKSVRALPAPQALTRSAHVYLCARTQARAQECGQLKLIILTSWEFL